jgi:tRNA(Arg) A34 adenosine deaminase TadA
MKEAVTLSRRAIDLLEGGPFGSVIVKDGIIVAKGWNQVLLLNDPTAHAEVVAIRAACRELGTPSLEGCQIYTSCEPCPMCLGAIYWARPDVIYYANNRNDAAAIGFDDDFIYKEIALTLPERSIPMHALDKTEAMQVFQEWYNRADRNWY